MDHRLHGPEKEKNHVRAGRKKISHVLQDREHPHTESLSDPPRRAAMPATLLEV